MGKVLSPYEKFIQDRDQAVVSRFTKLFEDGTNRMAAYRIIGDEMVPPLHDTAVLRILKKYGLPEEQAKFGRKRKVEEFA